MYICSSTPVSIYLGEYAKNISLSYSLNVWTENVCVPKIERESESEDETKRE